MAEPPPAGSRVAAAGVRTELVAEALASGSGLTFVTRGGSMSPFLRQGDRVTVAPLAATPAGLAAGDVAAFRDPVSGRIFVHRLLARRDQGWLARGDRNARPDGVIPDPHILGQVVAVERRGRRVFLPRGTLGLLLPRLARPLLELRACLRRRFARRS